MDISELKQELLDNKIRPFYVFTGNELALQDIYINKISQVSNLQVVRIDNLTTIFNTLTIKSLIQPEPKVYVIRNDSNYINTNEKTWNRMINAKSLQGNILILLYNDIKKDSKFCKFHEQVLTQFDFVGESLLKNRLQAVTQMPMPYCEDIVRMCGCNYGRIKNELYKLNVFAQIHNYSWSTAYLQAKQLDLIHEDIGDIIFDFTNAIVDRNIKKAYNLWPKMKFTDDGPMRIITVLYNTFRQILMVQSTPQNERTEQVLGMTKGQIYITSQKCDKYNLFEIVDIVKALRYLEKGIKTGEVAEEFAIDYLMGTIW